MRRASVTTSLKSALLDYQYENGRRYQGYGKEKYFLPADETEADRLDLVSHMLNLCTGGKLHFAPIGDNPQRILDLGTGTGIWAIDMGDQYPSADVLGNDLADNQPRNVPPNVRFEIDDIEQEWIYSEGFDYIHMRMMGGALKDWPKLLRQAFKFTKPGGWVEFMDFTMTFNKASPSGHFERGCPVDKWTVELKDLMHGIGLDPEPGPKLLGWFKDTGFTNINQKTFHIPVGTWPKDKTMKEIGTINAIQFMENLEGFTLRPLTMKGWKREEIMVFIADVRKDFKNSKLQMQHDGYAVWAQKPLD
ncbi:S-adenosyl-L-methionine-dependent methyltransferase [Eremomyces bilateralis CBS 781.70]|uniref:S-adenosyl-L-methionine-dependent methyltransferase n=1 Tax=Eremomyces bilateralis CBS 781.70 TaxID=1392243 RepID=A0A6G1GCS1_9PEZI|nr:S-adenosyl-L-methionine-dependent methyltransferase [Eremomyces bilateralis CBS 781.70]KAF1815802.1 S-adenosyl-L-methionine-dependent methyltransferase [Eremomyces bilateralis CBS 781.70]